MGNFWILFMIFLYFVPTALAVCREHRQMAPVIIVNVLLGWTLIGWVAALAWAAMNEKEKQA